MVLLDKRPINSAHRTGVFVSLLRKWHACVISNALFLISHKRRERRQPQAVQYRQRLVETIESSLGHHLSPLVREAFLTTPREAFVNQYYRQRENSLEWDKILHPMLYELYQDCYLVTRLNERKLPSSSSSQPSIMAAQLEALSLGPGHHVLEIGVGTGYNASLMAHMVGSSGTVISVDIAKDLVQRAADRLQHIGISNVKAFAADGYEGYAPYAPYDRLLATCSVTDIPPFWLSQLRERGILIANVLLPLVSIFVRIQRVGEIGIGTLLPIKASYMPLTGPHSSPGVPRFHMEELANLPQKTLQLEKNLEKLLRRSNGFTLLFSCFCPTLASTYLHPSRQPEHPYTLYLVSQPQHETIICVQKDCLTIYGQVEPLASAIKMCLQTYHTLGDPQVEECALSLHETVLTLSRDGQTFSLPHLMDKRPLFSSENKNLE